MAKPRGILIVSDRARHDGIRGYDITEALALGGLRGQLHPADAYAFLYLTESMFDDYTEANIRLGWGPDHHLGPWLTDAGWVGIIDMRRNPYAAAGNPYPAVDPAEPDDTPPRRWSKPRPGGT